MDTTKFSQKGASTNMTQLEKINLTEIIEDMFLVLTLKEKEVIIKRFSLDDQPKQTLEKMNHMCTLYPDYLKEKENNSK